MAFGASDTKHRTRSEIDAAFRDLPGLRVVTEQIQQHPDVAVARGHYAEPA